MAYSKAEFKVGGNQLSLFETIQNRKRTRPMFACPDFTVKYHLNTF
jgi:hypothetical protein